MVSVTFLKVCCHSDLSFSCRRCSYSGLVDFVTFSLPFYNFLQVIGMVIELGWVRNLRQNRGKGTGARGLDF